MSEFTHIDLRSARESHKMKRWELANELGVSEETIKRWEYGTQRPEPDDVGNIERILQTPGLWHKWMMSNYDSYRERHGDMPGIENLTAVVVQMRHEISDVIPLFDDIERDTLDGKINEPDKWKKFKKETLEAIAAMQQVLERIPDNI